MVQRNKDRNHIVFGVYISEIFHNSLTTNTLILLGHMQGREVLLLIHITALTI